MLKSDALDIHKLVYDTFVQPFTRSPRTIFREGESPAEPQVGVDSRLGRRLAFPANQHLVPANRLLAHAQ